MGSWAALPGHALLRAVPAAERSRLRFAPVPGLLQDRRDTRVGDEALEALFVPAEDHIDPVLPDELGGFGGRDTVRRGTVLEDQIEPSP
jgi:hypothetical protein